MLNDIIVKILIMSLAIIFQDIYLVKIIYKYLNLLDQINLGIINKITYKLHKKQLQRIKNIKHSAILSIFYLSHYDVIGEKKVYDEYDTLYTYSMKHLVLFGMDSPNSYDTFITLIKNRYERNWKGIRKSVDVNESLHFYPMYLGFIAHPKYAYMMTDKEIIGSCMHILKYIDNEKYKHINLIRLFRIYVQALNVKSKGKILTKNFKFIKKFLQIFYYHTNNLLFAWICKFLGVVATTWQTNSENIYITLYKNGSYTTINEHVDFIHKHHQLMETNGLLKLMTNEVISITTYYHNECSILITFVLDIINKAICDHEYSEYKRY